MTTTKDRILTCILTPLSWIYGGVVYMRNKMFDKGIILKETEFDIPVISVGNITVGGTGKTPVVEYLVRLLSLEYNIGVLSRGYKRKTKGFILANAKSTPEFIGDESYQIYQKYGMRIRVAVCEDRVKGIKQLLEADPSINLIILDDAFQHRYVKPRLSILLMDYSRKLLNDRLLPLGTLRESLNGINRADMVMVTKCPTNLQPIDYRLLKKEFDLMAFQKLFFSRYIYGSLLSVFPDDSPYSVNLSSLTDRDSVLLLTAIAHPRSFIRHFKEYSFEKKIMHFPDHHYFSRNDIREIKNKFDAMPGARKVIITTEKDAVRLSTNPYFPQSLKPFIFYLPIVVDPIEAGDDGDFITAVKKALISKQKK